MLHYCRLKVHNMKMEMIFWLTVSINGALTRLCQNGMTFAFFGTRSVALVNRYFNSLLSQFELFIHVLGLYWYQHSTEIFFPMIVLCCTDQLVLQLHEMIAIGLNHCKILYQTEQFLVIFFENFVVHMEVLGIIFGPRKLSESVLEIAKVHISDTSYFVQGSTSIGSHGRTRKHTGSWKV